MDTIHKVLDYLQVWLAGITAEQWYMIGTIVGSIPVVIGIVAWIKRRHVKKTAEKLASEFIVLNVAFWGFIISIADFIITQGTQFASLLPFVGTHWGQISAGAIVVHSAARRFHKWFQDRKNKEPLALPQAPETPLVTAESTVPTPPPQPPSVRADLWQDQE